MRKIAYSLSVSVDGFFEGPDGSIDWASVNEELHEHFNTEFAAAEAEFAPIRLDMPEVVHSRTLESVGWT